MMKVVVVALAAVVVLGACTSVESTGVNPDEVVANGQAVAVVQGTALGMTLLFHIVDLVQADLDTVVNKLLVSEAKAIGASRVDVRAAHATPRHGIFHVLTCPTIVLCPTLAQATGIAVK